MKQQASLPEIGFLRALSPAGPYLAGDVLSAAFVDPAIVRLRAHERESGAAAPGGAGIVPETMDAVVTAGAGPFRRDDVVTLWFVNPAVARVASAASAAPRAPAQVAAEPAASGNVVLRLDWTRERVARFVQVVDKLFTVERLGWYRHALAMRLLLPDDVVSPDPHCSVEGTRRLRILRDAAHEALGAPLLAAFMPNFNVTPEWLESISTPAVDRALAEFRDFILPFAGYDAEPEEPQGRAAVGGLRRDEILRAQPASVEAFLPLLLPARSRDPVMTERLDAYRSTLLELFGQTARAAEAVRLRAMTEVNRLLDDRLWQLVGAVQETYGGSAAA